MKLPISFNLSLRNRSLLRKFLFPLLPVTRAWRIKKWYKLVSFITAIVAFTSIYTALWMIFLFLIMPKEWMDSPLYDSIYHFSYFLAYIPLNVINLLSQFPLYGKIFHALFPIPFIGPILLILLLDILIYFTPGLLFRLILALKRNFYRRKVKISLAIILIGLVMFISSVSTYQKLINEGSVITDEQCLKVNPLIIQRKNSYINSMNVLQKAGSADEYWAETNKYLDYSKQFITEQNKWLALQRAYLDRSDVKKEIPEYIRKAGNLQYESRVAEVKSTMGIIQYFENFKTLNQKQQEDLSNSILAETQKSSELAAEYSKMYDNPPSMLDFRDNFTRVPQTKCPDENFNIPNVQDILNPPAIPNSPLS